MKKTLLSLMLLGSIYGTAQILQQENFDALNTATAIGQSSPVYALYGGAASDYSIVVSGTGKALQISVPATASGYRYMWKNGLAAAWTTRTAGNNVFQVEYDYFTGAASTSDNGGGIEVIDDPAGKVFCGLTVHQATKTVLGLYTTSTGTNSSTDVGAGTTPAAVTLPANTWVRLGFAYNATNGTVTFKGPGFSKVITGTLITSPAEIDYAAYDLVGTNTVTSTHLFDNMIARAVATESLNLATSDVVLKEQSVSIFPSPANDFITVESKAKILNAYIYDMTGVRSDANFADGKVDVRKLPSGVYMLGLKTENGLLTKKFIKK
ncbi:T9SS type A sorting domain-containing protein [Chryseobacterium luquanense]|uniref:T9SS type A sorting domain-containing protein n=1 Tax=Chryseobacterium luquanense TaxID=2983766 RepID=A0ABT3Y2E1_9FLAO|nr:T9SS type A sorting domain-containing protein [Chryseobacterium luquanense]MCX8532316.1 T9SS type A sorting domain-containing protein [Chryseobacterium luquanense]